MLKLREKPENVIWVSLHGISYRETKYYMVSCQWRKIEADRRDFKLGVF